jgi:hypothetical protein
MSELSSTISPKRGYLILSGGACYCSLKAAKSKAKGEEKCVRAIAKPQSQRKVQIHASESS